MHIKIKIMENIHVFIFTTLGIISFWSWKNFSYKSIGFISTLLLISVIFSTKNGFEDTQNGNIISFVGALLVLLNWIISRFVKVKLIFFIGISSTFLYLIFYSKSFVFDEYDLAFYFKDALILPLLASLFPIFALWKASFISKWFSIDNVKLDRVIMLYGLGILSLTGFVFGNLYGLVLVAIGYHCTQVYILKRDAHDYRFSIALSILALLGHFLKNSGLELQTITHGSTLMGFFFGAGAISWLTLFGYKRNSNRVELSVLKRIIIVLIPLLAIIGAILNEKIKENTGGISTFSGVMIGMFLFSYFINFSLQAVYLSILSFTMAFGYFVSPVLKPSKELTQSNEKIEKLLKSSGVNEKKTVSSENLFSSFNAIKLSDFKGNWIVDKTKSKVNFELGPVGSRTKGIFREVQGKFNISDNSQHKIEIQLPLKGMSTFNKIRDVSLMEKEYFDASKYPTISFKSNEIVENDDLSYSVKGSFVMKGIKEEIEIKLKLISNGENENTKKEYLLFVGNSSIDRTKHNMEPDSKIGNIVDFNFEIECTKK
jgi:polyisoprenoid-binding protein YceI